MSEYQKQANDFLSKYKIQFEAVFSHNGKHFEGDTENRDIYNATFSREGREFSIVFGDSIRNTELRTAAKRGWSSNGKYLGSKQRRKILKETKPTAYDILACLQKYEVGDFDDFISEYGYEINKPGDLRRLQKLHIAVYEEYDKLRRFFNNEELAELIEIQ